MGATSSRNQVAGACNVSRSTAQKYVRRFEISGVGWPLPQGMTEADLEVRMFAPPQAPSPAKTPDWQALHQELSRKGMALKLLWKEYLAPQAEGYGYSRFCDKYGGMVATEP